MGKWVSSTLDGVQNDWVYNAGLYKIFYLSVSGLAMNTELRYEDSLNPKTFYKDVTYQLITGVSNFNFNKLGSTTLKIDDIPQEPLMMSNIDGYLFVYKNQNTDVVSDVIVKYNADLRIANPEFGIKSFKVKELNYFINGYCNFKKDLTDTFDFGYDGGGWYSNSGTFSYFNSPFGYLIPKYKPVENFTNASNKHFIAFKVTTAFFDLSFNYDKDIGTSVNVYVIDKPPRDVSVTDFNDNNLIEENFNDQFFEKFNLVGNNKWVYILPISLTSNQVVHKIYNIRTSGKYHEGNNKLYNLDNNLVPQNLGNVSYGAVVGNPNEKEKKTTLSKIGNGKFLSGIWENGVWNSGWREDQTVKEFYSIIDFNSTQKDKVWSFTLKGPINSVNSFEVGDKISIGNVIAIDINDKRNLIKTYFTVMSINDTFMSVQFEMNFPLRRIDIDSDNHRILVSKNVWLHGAFLNGYFKGVWNDGIFKGLPLITEMYDTHWLDGVLEGGHFKSNSKVGTFSYLDTKNDNVGISFSVMNENFEIGDKLILNNAILIDKEVYITSVDNGMLVTDLKSLDIEKVLGSTLSGTYSLGLSTGLIQNVIFDSKNVSKLTSTTDLTNNVFQYNSWLDLNFETQSAVNIGRPTTLLNEYSNNYYSLNNLYGYPTNDVLKSVSAFRDSFSLTNRNYALGKKYNIYYDYVGNSSNFENYFKDNGDKFLEQGWTYSNIQNDILPGSITFSTTKDLENGDIVGKELKITAWGRGGVLDVTTSQNNIENKTNADIERGRYTIIEFDLLTHSVAFTTFSESVSYHVDGYTVSTTPTGLTVSTPIVYKSLDTIESPVLHFDNLNIVNRYNENIGIDELVYATYLPIYKNVNHLETSNKKKVEYFYNKSNLSLNLRGSDYDVNTGVEGTSQSSIVVDNLKLYEVDMIPFFKYFEDDNINKSVQLPYEGISPIINYDNYDPSLLKDKSFGISSINIYEKYDSIKKIN